MVCDKMGITVTLPYDPNWLALNWAKNNCTSYITNKASARGVDYDIVYYFSNEKDAIAFMLKWS